MMLALKILGLWFAVALIISPILIPMLARRFARHDDWVERDRLANRAFVLRFVRLRHAFGIRQTG
jgi:hypothetical protein